MNRCSRCLKLARTYHHREVATLQKVKKLNYSQKVNEIRSEEQQRHNTPSAKDDVDLVSPPNPHSNIRKVVYSKARTRGEEYLNSKRWQTNLWNDEFWKNHNEKFFKEKREFIERAHAASGSGQEVSDKLSVFYKEFLEKNHDIYMTYNREWYKRNFGLLWMSVRTSFTSIVQRQQKI